MFLFSEIMGHDDIKEHLQTAIREDKPFHAYIFQGEVGCGKETMARTFAAGLQCLSEERDRPCGTCASCKQTVPETAGYRLGEPGIIKYRCG